MSNIVEIKFDYTPKSIAIFGNTKPFSEIIKEKGGKFNPSLNYGTEDEPDRKPGWIFPSSKRSIVEQLVNDINDGTIKANNLAGTNSNTKTSSSLSNNSKSNVQHDYIERKAFMALISRIEKLEQEVALLSQKINSNPSNNNAKKTVIEFKEDNSEDEESNNEENSDDDTPIPSLLKAKKQHK